MCTYFKTETEEHSIGRHLNETEPLYAELNKRVEAVTSAYPAIGEFLQYIYSVFMAKNHQKIQSRCLVHEFSFKDISLNFGLYGCGYLLLL